jgi:hypothetical protein
MFSTARAILIMKDILYILPFPAISTLIIKKLFYVQFLSSYLYSDQEKKPLNSAASKEVMLHRL